MAKRFPIPEFDYEDLREVAWSAPTLLSVDEVRERIDAGERGAWPVAAPDAFYDAFDLDGEHRCAVVCALPAGAHMLGRSHAWNVQRLVAVEGLPEAGAAASLDWKTPRPMNTRLGPQDGIDAPAQVLTLVSGHRYDARWVANRCAVDGDWAPENAAGVRVTWCDDAERNNFHSVVVSFAWAA